MNATYRLHYVDNLTEHNGDCGLVANAEVSGCQDVTIERNISRFNVDYGLQLRLITNLILRHNTFAPNGKGDVSGP